MTTAKILEMIKGLLYGPFFDMGNMIWDTIMFYVFGAMTTTPQGYSADAWNYVSGTVYPWSMGIASVLLNLFFMIGFFRQTANIKENMTTEILVSLLVKVIMANVLLTSGLDIIQTFFTMSAGLSAQIFFQPPSYTATGVTGEDMLFFQSIYGAIYMIVAVVCAAMIFLAVYGRYLKLYVSVCVGPIAISTLAGGVGLESTAHAWIKSFLSYTFEIVVIAIELSIAGKIIGGMNWGMFDGVGSILNGAARSAQAMFTMIILAGTVKGTDTLMHRMLAL